jgi:peptidylprolyl isomerase
MIKQLFWGLAALVALSAWSCDDQVEGKLENPPVSKIAQAKKGAKPPFQLDSSQLWLRKSGLRYQVIEMGEGPIPQKGQKVTVHYHGTLRDGTVFDSSVRKGEPFTFPLGQGRVVEGWDKAFSFLPVGTRAILIVPPELGYGASGRGSIPGNATLRFDVTILDTQPSEGGGGRRGMPSGMQQMRRMQAQQGARRVQGGARPGGGGANAAAKRRAKQRLQRKLQQQRQQQQGQ